MNSLGYEDTKVDEEDQVAGEGTSVENKDAARKMEGGADKEADKVADKTTDIGELVEGAR